MLPEPTLTFTIPSLHDDTILKCRVYHPFSLSPSLKAPPWQHHAAIVAHPYAPLGGNYDDSIVSLIASTLLRAGFMVCTFNFRGAIGSVGRTSWTAKAERADYMSVAGFLCHYAHFLDPFRQNHSDSTSPLRTEHAPSSPNTSSPASSSDPNRPAPVLLLSGYSYGALVTSQIPSIQTILEPFRSPKTGTAAAEIRLRAEHLADVQNTVLGSARRAAEQERRVSAGAASPRKSLGLRVGGDEDITRKSHDGHRSLRASFEDTEDKIRRGVSDLLAKTRVHHHSQRKHRRGGSAVSQVNDKDVFAVTAGEAEINNGSKLEHGDVEQMLPILGNPPSPRAAYLLVSPPIGWAGSLTALSWCLPPLPKMLTRKPSVSLRESDSPLPVLLDEGHQKLVDNPSLLIYGDNDLFVTNKKMREWSTRLQDMPGSLFRAHEVSTAGHFWTEGSPDGGDVVDMLHHAVHTFSLSLLR